MLGYPAGSGTVTASPQAASYAAGALVTLTATPADGYRFVKWQGDASGLVSPTTVTLNADTSIEALFAPALTSAAAVITATVPTSLTLSEPDASAPIMTLSFPGAAQSGNVVLNSNTAGEAHAGVIVGFAGGVGLARSVTIHCDLPAESFVALIEVYYTDEEVAGLNETQLRLFRWNEAEQQWKLTGTMDRGASAPTGQLGDHGVDIASNRVWAIVDRFSEFSIGLTETSPSGEVPDVPADELPEAPAEDEQVLADPVEMPAPCGTCGAGVPLMSSLGLIALALLRRTR